MKLLYITNGITGSGGLERVLSVKASILAEDFGYEVHILSLNESNQQPFFEFSNQVRLHSTNVGGNLIRYITTYITGIRNIVRRVKPDIILVCDDALKGFFLPHLISTKAKWIYESHASLHLTDNGGGISEAKKFQHRLKQVLGKRFDKMVVLTKGNCKEWSLKQIVVIPNPLPFQSAEIACLQSKNVIAVGSYSYNKGYDLLLQIWAKTHTNFPDWQLNVYGRGTIENLAPQAERLRLKNIYFNDPVLHIDSKYMESSIFVLPSRSEGFGMVLIEAMSCGLPGVSFDCPHGPADIITDCQDGFLVENGDTEKFAKKLQKLMYDEELRTRMGAAGKEASQKYQADNTIKQWDELLRQLH